MSPDTLDVLDSHSAVLVGLVGSLEGRRLVLEGRRLILGRDSGKCQLVLEHALVSREHAAFEVDEAGRISVQDLGSTHGTFVNNEPVAATRELRHGDTVGFGRMGVVAFRFEQTPASLPASLQPSREQLSVAEVRARLHAAGEAASRAGRSIFPAVASAVPAQVHAPSLLKIGRAADNDIVLESPAVSRYHARISYTADDVPVVSDAGSTNGTFVNGQPVQDDRELRPGDLVFIGGFLLRFTGRKVDKYDLSSSRIIASGVGQSFGERNILQDISFAILPREFIGLMGPSGCGKSTLMDALNGLRPASAGTVRINDLDLYKNFDAVRRSIGYVPQRDVLHDALTVERTLHYAARLRLPEHASDADRRRVIDEAITTVGLQEHRSTPFDRLSGGQQKRLSTTLSDR